MLEWTGERYLPFIEPSVCGAEIHYEHMHRYAFASQYVKNKKVLDLASGEGFGTTILSKDAECVVGIDIDHEAILHASKTYEKENITFLEGSILNIPIEGRKIFDVIVCFEAIEHVMEHDILFQEIKRLLKDDGILIISSPNKKIYSDDTGYKNPYHQKELYYSEFFDLLNKNFPFIYLSGQRIFSGSSIYPVSSQEITSFSEFAIKLEDNHFSFSSEDESQPRYFIAIASNVQLDPKQIQKSYLLDKSNAEIALLNNQIVQYNTSIQSLQQNITHQDSQIQGMTARAAELLKHTQNLELIVAERDTQVAELQKHSHNLGQIITNRDTQVGELQKHIRNLNEIVADRDTQVAELQKHSYDLGKIISNRDTQVTELQKHSYDLGQIISNRDRQISELIKHAENLELIVTDRETQVAELRKHTENLELIVTDRDTLVAELRRHTENLELIVIDRETQVAELRTHAQNLEEIINNQNQQLQEFIRFNQSLSNENLSIKQSLTYNLTTKFHNKIVERLLPQNTRRRKYYNLGLSGSRILINEGWDRFWWCYRERKHPKISGVNPIISIPPQEKAIPVLENLPVIPEDLPVIPEDLPVIPEDLPVIPEKISVIIPTKNAGPDFPSVLEKILSQKGITSVEIIIVDSGSTDDTLQVAEKFGCGIFAINPEEFNHGLTRNYGVEQASGEFIVLLVQDAIPIGDYWLSSMANFFKDDDKIAAVTCRQVPRSDADLFAGFILWSHYRSLKRTRDRIYSCENGFDNLTPLDKRVSAGIEDTCCMMQKKIFDRFKFRNIQYGEDLDLGIRLIKDGNKTGFMFSTAVIHSHNRDSLYFFKRSFVDLMILDSLLNVIQKPIENNDSIKDLVEQILGLYSDIYKCITNIRSRPMSGVQAIDNIKKILRSPVTDTDNRMLFTDTGQLTDINPINKLGVLLTDCARLVNANSIRREDSLIASYCSVLDSFSEYCSVYSSMEGRESEFYESFEKMFALVAGSTLAAYYCKRSESQLSDSEVALKKILEGGI